VATCGQCERFQQRSRTQVEQQVASVNGSIEIHGEQQVQQLVAQLVWQHVASVKALLLGRQTFKHGKGYKRRCKLNRCGACV